MNLFLPVMCFSTRPVRPDWGLWKAEKWSSDSEEKQICCEHSNSGKVNERFMKLFTLHLKENWMFCVSIRVLGKSYKLSLHLHLLPYVFWERKPLNSFRKKIDANVYL